MKPYNVIQWNKPVAIPDDAAATAVAVSVSTLIPITLLAPVWKLIFSLLGLDSFGSFYYFNLYQLRNQWKQAFILTKQQQPHKVAKKNVFLF